MTERLISPEERDAALEAWLREGNVLPPIDPEYLRSEEQPHTERAHAALSPSGSKLWTNCAGQINLCRGLADTSGPEAREGTAAHELIEHCLNTGFNASDFAGFIVDINATTIPSKFLAVGDENKDTKWEVTEEMVEAVQMHLDKVRGLIEDGDEYETECRLDLREIHPDIYGTGDFLRYRPSTQELVVVDFKYGRGVFVSVEENPQLLTYALGARLRYHNRGISTVRIIIVQPRCTVGGPAIREWSLSSVDLFNFERELADKAKATEDPNAPLTAGEWCKDGFCGARGFCPAYRDWTAEQAGIEFGDDAMLPDVRKFTPEALAKSWLGARALENYVKAVRALAHSEAVAGRMPPGLKFVAKRPARRYKNPAEAEQTLRMIVDEDDLYERKMKSPAKMEAVLGGKKKAAGTLGPLVESASSGTVLAPLEDKREAVSSNLASEFEDES